jgi:hypothetical protein
MLPRAFPIAWPLRASVGSTVAHEKDICGSMRFRTLVTLDP